MKKFVELNNKIKMPTVGFGTYQMPARITKRCVLEAISVGYRLIDTAQCYYNEREVGEAIRESGMNRDEFFITTKLWGCRSYSDTLKSIESSLKSLNLDYIDLLLIHEPTGDFCEIYRAMEKFYRDGKIRALGVANFLESNFQKLIQTAEIIPTVDQIETHIFRQQTSMNKLLKRFNTIHQSWSPLAAGKNGIFENPTLTSIAKNHGKTVAQIALRYLLQLEIPIIPKTTHIERMLENLDVFDFELTSEEIVEIQKLDENRSLFNWW